MLAQLLSPPYQPFVIAFVVMFGIGLIEAIGLGFGHLEIDHGGGADAHGGLLDWLGLSGELPVLVWLTSLLACFTVAGVAIQQGVTAAFGAPLDTGFAVAGAAICGVCLNTLAANGLARIMPGLETSVIDTDDLLRRRGTILEGTARRGSPARAKIIDQHGQAHFVMVEPHDDAGELPSGETALLVRREGKLFFGLPDRETSLRSM